MLSAVLLIIYTADCTIISKHAIVKNTDDTVIIGLVSNEDVTTYTQEINHFVDWCNNFLNLNVTKPKEMIADYSKSSHEFTPVNIKCDNVELVEEYKHLGNIDHKLNGNLNVSQIHKQCNQRL